MHHAEIKTSAEWMADCKNMTLIDPDGWDRENWRYSFYEEKISLETFLERLMASTIEIREK